MFFDGDKALSGGSRAGDAAAGAAAVACGTRRTGLGLVATATPVVAEVADSLGFPSGNNSLVTFGVVLSLASTAAELIVPRLPLLSLGVPGATPLSAALDDAFEASSSSATLASFTSLGKYQLLSLVCSLYQ